MAFLVAIAAGVEDVKVGEWTIADREWCKGEFQTVARCGTVEVLERDGSEWCRWCLSPTLL